jgi:hypothetical protein
MLCSINPTTDAIVSVLRRTARIPVQDKMPLPKEQKEKGRMLRTSSLVLLIFSRPWSQGSHPHPSPRDDQTV